MTAEEFKYEVNALRPMLLSMACGYLGNTDDADDTVQEVLLKLWTLCAELHSPVAPLARVLVRNYCIDRIRRRRPTVDISQTDLPDLSSAAETDARIERIMTLIDTLPTAQQIIMRLRHVEGMSVTDIADVTGSTEGAVRKAMSRARMAVRDKYFAAADGGGNTAKVPSGKIMNL